METRAASTRTNAVDAGAPGRPRNAVGSERVNDTAVRSRVEKPEIAVPARRPGGAASKTATTCGQLTGLGRLSRILMRGVLSNPDATRVFADLLEKHAARAQKRKNVVTSQSCGNVHNGPRVLRLCRFPFSPDIRTFDLTRLRAIAAPRFVRLCRCVFPQPTFVNISRLRVRVTRGISALEWRHGPCSSIRRHDELCLNSRFDTLSLLRASMRHGSHMRRRSDRYRRQ